MKSYQEFSEVVPVEMKQNFPQNKQLCKVYNDIRLYMMVHQGMTLLHYYRNHVLSYKYVVVI